ncbi:MAG: ankyrin repeat domain-containing protein [Vicinamibacterales bacterium]
MRAGDRGSTRHLPVRPDLTQLTHQARDLQRQARAGDPAAAAELRASLGAAVPPGAATLAQARFALARSYGVASWPRLAEACRLVDAIWRDEVLAVRAMVRRRPALLVEMARGTVRCNWGPPMSYAANLGRDAIVRMLWDLGARDVEGAVGRAVLQGRLATATLLRDLAGRPPLPPGAVMGPCETLNAEGLAYVLDLGAAVADGAGDPRAPVALVLGTYSRRPRGKHACLELLLRHGVALPDTPPMAVHRGRVDLLARHLEADPGLLDRTFAYDAFFPPALGCHPDDGAACTGTPLGGATLLHMAIDYGELDIAAWLLDRGMDPDTPAAITGGWGGHTALFGAVVSYAARIGLTYPGVPADRDPFADLLLSRGASPNPRASLRSRLHVDSWHEYRDVTPLGWGARFHDPLVVSQAAMQAIAARGGRV